MSTRRPTHKRLVIAGDRSIRVQGDFGGGYTEPIPPNDPQARARAICRALIYMPGARLIDCEAGDALAELKALAGVAHDPG